MLIKGDVEKKLLNEDALRCSLYAGKCTCSQDWQDYRRFIEFGISVQWPSTQHTKSCSRHVLFRNPKMSLKGEKFHVSEMITTVEYYLNNQTIIAKAQEMRCIYKLVEVGHAKTVEMYEYRRENVFGV